LAGRMAGTGWKITNLGAILLARRLTDFPSLARKALRVIRYAGVDRLRTTNEQVGGKGYAAGFEGLIDYVNAFFPANEAVTRALRTTTPFVSTPCHPRVDRERADSPGLRYHGRWADR